MQGMVPLICIHHQKKGDIEHASYLKYVAFYIHIFGIIMHIPVSSSFCWRIENDPNNSDILSNVVSDIDLLKDYNSSVNRRENVNFYAQFEAKAWKPVLYPSWMWKIILVLIMKPGVDGWIFSTNLHLLH